MLETSEKEINGRTYQYQPLMLKPARKLFAQLLQRFGPAAASAIEGLQSAELNEDMEMTEALGSVAGSVGGLIRGAVQGLDPTFYQELCDTLEKQVTVYEDGNQMALFPDYREVLFGASLATEFEVIWFCLESQFSDFLAPMQRAANMAVALRAKAGSSYSSQKESNGSPTELPQASATPTA